MRILGLDLSLTATGVAWEGGTGLISTKLRGMERLDHIAGAVAELVWNGVHFTTDLVVMEGYSFGSQGRSVFDIGELGGVIKLELYRHNVPVVEVAPAMLKKFATGKGNVGKDEVLAAAIRKYAFEGTNNNEADAWILYWMGRLHYDRNVEPLYDYQREALEKIEWPVLV